MENCFGVIMEYSVFSICYLCAWLTEQNIGVSVWCFICVSLQCL